jgi:hypothetical protein
MIRPVVPHASARARWRSSAGVGACMQPRRHRPARRRSQPSRARTIRASARPQHDDTRPVARAGLFRPRRNAQLSPRGWVAARLEGWESFGPARSSGQDNPARRGECAPWPGPWRCMASWPGGPGLRQAQTVRSTVCVRAQPGSGGGRRAARSGPNNSQAQSQPAGAAAGRCRAGVLAATGLLSVRRAQPDTRVD